MTLHNSFHWTLAFLFWSVGPMQSCIFYNGIRTFFCCCFCCVLQLLWYATLSQEACVSFCMESHCLDTIIFNCPMQSCIFYNNSKRIFFCWFFHCVTISQFFCCVVLPLASRNVVSRVPTVGKAIESLVRMQFVATFPYLHLARLTK